MNSLKLVFKLYHYRRGDGTDVFKLKRRRLLGLYWWQRRIIGGYDWSYSEVATWPTRERAIAYAHEEADKYRKTLAAEKAARLTLVIVEKVEV